MLIIVPVTFGVIKTLMLLMFLNSWSALAGTYITIPALHLSLGLGAYMHI